MYYCEECGKEIESVNDFGDNICEECEVYCEKCGWYCSGEHEDGMCLDCHEDYMEDLDLDEDKNDCIE